jgi:hypothetical protein
MNHRFASLVVAAAAVSSGSYALTSAQSARHQNVEVEIIVNGVAQRRYAHDGRFYVEALKGREYAVRLRNPYPVRAGVALSVDGLNTIDARRSSAADARMWVLDPYETVTISGWQTSRTEARRFEFTTEARSYGQALGETANLGVITAVFFKERAAAIVREGLKEGTSRRDASPPVASAVPSVPTAGSSIADGASLERLAEQEYAATGMGRRTRHAVTEIWLDLEPTPAQTVNIRYEYRRELVRLGIVPVSPLGDGLQRRERARGFEPGFSPEVPRR